MTNIVKNSCESERLYNGYGVAFDGKSEWKFGNDKARNVLIFGVDNSLSSHTHN